MPAPDVLVTQTSTHLRTLTGAPIDSIAIEIAIPATGAGLLGAFILGVSKLGSLAWYDLTERWQGCDITEGSDEGALAVGEMTITFDNQDGTLSPWSTNFPNGANLYAGPGTLIRVVAKSAGTFFALATMRVEKWVVDTDGLSSVKTVTITAVETMAVLGSTNDLPLLAPVGAGESTPDRMARLLAAAKWQFGVSAEADMSTGVTHQATDQSANRLGELDLTAHSRPDATGVTAQAWRFFTDRFGQAWWGAPGKRNDIPPFSTAGTPITLTEANDIDGDTLRGTNDEDLRLNIVTLGAANGGATTTYTNGLSVGRNGYAADVFTDYNCVDGTVLDPIANEFLSIGDITLRPATFDVDAVNYPAIARLAPWVGINLTTVDGVVFSNYRVAKVTHHLMPLGEKGLRWTANVTMRPTASTGTEYPTEGSEFAWVDEGGDSFIDEFGEELW